MQAIERIADSLTGEQQNTVANHVDLRIGKTNITTFGCNGSDGYEIDAKRGSVESVMESDGTMGFVHHSN